MRVKNLIDFLEKDRLNYVGIFVLVLFLGVLRKYFEHAFIYKSVETGFATYYGMMFTQLSVFLGGTLIIAYFAREKIKIIMNVAVMIIWIIALPPVFDYYIFHVPEDFVYFNVKLMDLGDIPEIITAGLATGHSPGIILMGSIIILMSGLYLFFKTRSISRTFLGILVFYLFSFLFAGQFYNIVFVLLGVSLVAGLRPLLISFVISILTLFKESKNLAIGFLNGMKPLKNIYFILLVMTGVLIGGNYGHPLAYLTPTLIRILIITFIWQFTVVLNNVFDYKIDATQKRETPITAGLISRKAYLEMGIIFGILAILMSLLMNSLVFVLITSLALAVSVVYSVPPIRIRDHVLSTWCIGIGSVFAFLIGYFAETGNPLSITFSPNLSQNIIYLMIILFSAVTIGTSIKDIEDYSGDKKYGIRNLFTVYGKNKGKKITSSLLFLSFLTPVLLFHGLIDITMFLITATFAVIVFRKFEKQNPVIFLSFIIFIYCALRLSGVILS